MMLSEMKQALDRLEKGVHDMGLDPAKVEMTTIVYTTQIEKSEIDVFSHEDGERAFAEIWFAA